MATVETISMSITSDSVAWLRRDISCSATFVVITSDPRPKTEPTSVQLRFGTWVSQLDMIETWSVQLPCVAHTFFVLSTLLAGEVLLRKPASISVCIPHASQPSSTMWATPLVSLFSAGNKTCATLRTLPSTEPSTAFSIPCATCESRVPSLTVLCFGCVPQMVLVIVRSELACSKPITPCTVVRGCWANNMVPSLWTLSKQPSTCSSKLFPWPDSW